MAKHSDWRDREANPKSDDEPFDEPFDPLAAAPATRLVGIVRRMNFARGYGFIESGDGQSRFFHRTMCDTPYEILRDGDAVYFTPDDTSDKGARALHVQKLRT